VKLFILILVAMALDGLGGARPAHAQTPASLPRFDAAGSVGWLAARDHRPSRYSRRWANSLIGGGSVGVYWTDHLKLEIDAGAGTEARLYVNQPIQVDGRDVWQHIEVASSRRVVGISQQYQYGRNAWFHPHVGAGVHLTWERRTERHQPLAIYAPGVPPQTIREAFTDGPATRLTARPFVTTGFKGYLSPRAFFRSDLRIGFRRGLDEASVRAGFGFDF
jgi:hypothetical protein